MKNIALLTRYLLIVNKLQNEQSRYVMAGDLLRYEKK